MLSNAQRPLLGFAAYSGTGKTTLLAQVIPVLKERGIRVGVLKHAHHTFEIDYPGKDSHTLRKAGACQTLIASSKRWALVTETPFNDEHPVLNDMLSHLDQSQLDLILVEGFKDEVHPKIELHRPAHEKDRNRPFIHEVMPNIIAIASDEPVTPKIDIPQLDLNNIDQIIEFVIGFTNATPGNVKKLNIKN